MEVPFISRQNVKPTFQKQASAEKVVLKHPVDQGKSEERFPVKSSPHSLSRHCRLSNGARAPDVNGDRFEIDYKRFQIQGVRFAVDEGQRAHLNSKLKIPPQGIKIIFHLRCHCFKFFHLLGGICSSHLRFHRYTTDGCPGASISFPLLCLSHSSGRPSLLLPQASKVDGEMPPPLEAEVA